MRYAFLIAAIILAACTVPLSEQKPMSAPPSEQKPIPVSPPVDIAAPQENHPKLKQQIQKMTPAPAQSDHPCVGIKSDDPKSDVKAQLECLEEHG